MPSLTRRTAVVVVAAIAVVVAVVVGAALFQPWRLVTTKVVDEAIPNVGPSSIPPSSAAPPTVSGRPSAGPVVLARGTFVTHEHGTTGTVAVLKLADGSRVLRIENLDTSDGPDLEVWLSDAPVIPGRDGWHVFDDGRYHDLGDLKGNQGSQNYVIPADLDLAAFRSVSIWCDRFNVSFGAAALRTA